MNTIHFGIMMIFNLCIGTITPPVGTTLFVGVKVGKTRIEQVIQPLLYYFGAIFIVPDVSFLHSSAVTLAAGTAGICIKNRRICLLRQVERCSRTGKAHKTPEILYPGVFFCCQLFLHIV